MDTESSAVTMPEEKVLGRAVREEEKLLEEKVLEGKLQGEVVQEEKLQEVMVQERLRGEMVQRERLREEMVQQREKLRGEMMQREKLREEMMQNERVRGEMMQGEKLQVETVQLVMDPGDRLQGESVQEARLQVGSMEVEEGFAQEEKFQMQMAQQEGELQDEIVQEEKFQVEMAQGDRFQVEMVQQRLAQGGMVHDEMLQQEMVQWEMVQQEERLLEVTVKEEIVEPEAPGELLDSSSSPSHLDSGESDPDIDMAPLSSSPSSRPESEDEMEVPGSGWTAKNGQAWFPSNSETQCFIPCPRGVKAGPTRYAIANLQGLESTFDLFWTDEMISLIVNMTNIQASRTLKDWIEVDPIDIRAYIGLVILGGVYRSRGESTSSLWDDRSGRPIFRATMALKRFLEISRALSFHDKLQKPVRLANRQTDDKLEPIRVLWDMWAHRLPLLFNPGEDVTVDEQLVPFRGRCRFRQYVPKQPAKYGIKVWVTADVATTYAWKCDVHLGASDDAPQVDQGRRVAAEMTGGLRGVTVTCGNFFTSYSLAQELLRKKMALVGMIRKRKPELPPILVRDRERAVLSSLFAFTRNTTAVSYLPTKGRSVVLISTKHRDAVVTGGPKKKPEIINYYNHCKGVFDKLNKMVATYTCRRRTNRWPQMLFFNMLDISTHNAFVIYTAVDPSWNDRKNFKRRLFLEELGNSLVSAEILRRQRVPRAPFAAAVVRDIQASAVASGSSAVKRKRCQMCTSKNKKTFTVCVGCGANTCKDHQVVYCRSCWAT